LLQKLSHLVHYFKSSIVVKGEMVPGHLAIFIEQ